MNVAIIPARGGSKRIPHKNISLFCGRPMIAYAISAAVKSKLFDKIIVSTDSEEIAEIARDWGGEVPFMRPPELADDQTPTVPVIAHAINALTAQGYIFDYSCCIYPCVPFIRTEDLVNAFELLKTCDVGYCYPITLFPSMLQRALRRYPDGKIEPIYSQYEWARTQDLEPAYYDAGQFYWGKVSSWLGGLGLQSYGSGLLVPQWRVVDIDTPEDWDRAEILFKTFFEKST